MKLKTPKAKNIAKSFLQSGHKAIIHQGILTHVDRRRHFEVFGPTIDTLLMAAILNEIKTDVKPKSILEIGVGSGHIITVAINKIKSLIFADAMDINSYSIICTNENIKRLLSTNDFTNPELDLTLAIGKFAKQKFGRRYDLIICNPPYVTLPSEQAVQIDENFYEAVSGTELISEILNSLSELLTEKGRCLLMVSTTTLGFEDMIPPNIHSEVLAQERSLTVPFDLEAVFQDKNWLKFLLDNQAIWEVDGKYYHRLLPYWLGVKNDITKV